MSPYFSSRRLIRVGCLAQVPLQPGQLHNYRLPFKKKKTKTSPLAKALILCPGNGGSSAAEIHFTWEVMGAGKERKESRSSQAGQG